MLGNDKACTTTGGHWNPLKAAKTAIQPGGLGTARVQGWKCFGTDAEVQKNCERGDLSGRYGVITGTGTAETVTGTLQYGGSGEGNTPFFKGKSIVIHRQSDSDKTLWPRWRCATIRQAAKDGSGEGVDSGEQTNENAPFFAGLQMLLLLTMLAGLTVWGSLKGGGDWRIWVVMAAEVKAMDGCVEADGDNIAMRPAPSDPSPEL